MSPMLLDLVLGINHIRLLLLLKGELYLDRTIQLHIIVGNEFDGDRMSW